MKQKSGASKGLIAGLAVLLLLVAGGAFTWHEYRPRVVIARCSMEAEKRSDKDEFVYEIIYRHCLRSNGIEYIEQKE